MPDKSAVVPLSEYKRRYLSMSGAYRRDYRVIAVLGGGFKTLCLPTPGTAQYMIHSIISFILHVLGGLPFSKAGFQGALLQKEKSTYTR